MMDCAPNSEQIITLNTSLELLAKNRLPDFFLVFTTFGYPVENSLSSKTW
jgi:hypothetical protein